MYLEMTSDRPGKTESGKDVPVGTKVEYIAHLGGEAIKVRFPDGSVEVIHPLCFPELR